jgi:hypothetical protein
LEHVFLFSVLRVRCDVYNSEFGALFRFPCYCPRMPRDGALTVVTCPLSDALDCLRAVQSARALQCGAACRGARRRQADRAIANARQLSKDTIPQHP